MFFGTLKHINKYIAYHPILGGAIYVKTFSSEKEAKEYLKSIGY